MYPRTPEAKSTLFVEGLGCAKDATCDRTGLVKGPGLAGVRIDATHIFLSRMPVKFIGRLFLLLDQAYWLVIDHVLGKTDVTELCVESRFHTDADDRRGRNHVGLTSGKERVTDNLHEVALNPGTRKLRLKLEKSPAGTYVVTVIQTGERQRTIRFSPRLDLR